MSSEKRLQANRANARKSTGPKTEAGKEKSRRNALKHGLSGAGLVMRREDERKLAQRVNDFREVLAPINPLEDTLVERAALAAVRCESAVNQGEAERRRRVGKALSRLEARKRREIATILELLQTEPGRARRQLKRLARGLSWLIDEWRALADRLGSRGYLCCADAALALRLLGKEPELPYPDDAFVAAFRRAWLATLPELDLEATEAALGVQPGDTDQAAREQAVSALLPEPAAAREHLRRLIHREVHRLTRSLSELADDPTEAFERDEVIACAQVGTDAASAQLHRYERDQELSLHRSLNELIKIRKQEPELASIARWEKLGKKYNRRWDGYSWVPNAEWVAGGEERVAGGGWRVAGEREGGLTEVEPSPVTESEGDPQATPRVAGFSAWREPGAPQPQLPPEDTDPMAQEPVSATHPEAGARDRGFGAGEQKTVTDDQCLRTEQIADSAPLSHQPSVVSHPHSDSRNEPSSRHGNPGAVEACEEPSSCLPDAFPTQNGGAGSRRSAEVTGSVTPPA